MKKIIFVIPTLIIIIATAFFWKSLSNDEQLACAKTETYEYLASFHVCDTSENDCKWPAYHEVYLAGSNDGENWELIEEWEPVSGSVPDIFAYGDYLYEMNPNAGGDKPAVRKINRCFEVVDEEYIITIKDTDGSQEGYVDPSAIVVDGDMYWFFLIIKDNIPTKYIGTCENYPCDYSIGIAEPTDNTFSDYEIIGKVTKTLSTDNVGTMTDPDMIQLIDGRYLLVVSSGQNVYAFVSDDLVGPYESTDGNQWTRISRSGGVPSIAYINEDLWLYVTYSNNGVEEIRRARILDISKSIEPQKFETVMDGESLFGDSNLTISSINVISWPQEWK